MTTSTTRTTRELADGYEMPLLGLGVWQVPDGPECVNAVRWALELGYRHILAGREAVPPPGPARAELLRSLA